MLELGKPTHTFDAAAVHDGRIIVRRARAGRAARDARPRRPRRSTPRRSLIADPAGPIGIAGIMGGAGSEVGDATTEVIVESAIFDPVSIRRTALPLRAPVRGEPAVREGPGAPAGAARRRPRRRSSSRTGPAAVSRRARSTRLRVEPDAGARRVPARRASTASLGIDAPAATSSAPSWRGSASRRSRRPPGTRIVVAGRRSAAARGRRRRRRGHLTRPSRPGGATSSIEADVTEEVARVRGYELVPATLPDTPMPPYRPDPARGARRCPRDARRRRPDRGRHATRSSRRRWSSGSRPRRRRARGRAGGDARRAVRSPSRTRCRASIRSCARASSAASSRSSRRTSATAATTSRSSRSARATAPRDGERDPRVVAARRSRSTGAAEPPRLEPAGAALRHRRREGPHRAALPPAGLPAPGVHAASPTIRTSIPGRARRAVSAGRHLARPASASCTRRSSRRSSCAPSGSSSAELAIAGLCRRPAAAVPRRRPVAPSDGRARPRRRRRRRPSRRRGRGGHPAPRRPAPARRARCSTSTAAGRWPRATRASPTGSSIRDDDRTLTEAELDAVVAAVTSGPGRRRGARFRSIAARCAPHDGTGPPTADRGVVRPCESPDRRCYPCAALGAAAGRDDGGTSVDVGAFLDGVGTIDLLIVLFFMGFFVLGFAAGHDPPAARHRLDPVLVLPRRDPGRAVSALPRQELDAVPDGSTAT